MPERRLFLVAIVALLAGCAGLNSGPQSTSQGALVSPQAKGSELLYTGQSNGDVSIFTLNGTKVAEITGVEAGGLCSDSNGNVFVVQAQGVTEYAHGGTTPIATLSLSGNTMSGCAVDPKTGNLAVAGINSSGAMIAVFANAQGSPTVYQTSAFREFSWCAYDGSGNLFVNGSGLAELSSGSSSITALSPSESLNPDGPIQWDGKYVVVGNPKSGGHPNSGPNSLYQMTISGTKATVVNTIELSGGTGAKRNQNDASAQFWIQGKKIAAPRDTNGPIALWRYPGGGRPVSTIKSGGSPRLGLTISAGL
jgi:hypothetical protein